MARSIEAIRDRYDGERRNPWNEFECGNNYARSMASYALLNAFSGFQFDMVNQSLGFDPVRVNDGKFRCFWSLDFGWGEFAMTPAGCQMNVLYGKLNLKRLQLLFLNGEQISSVTVGESDVSFDTSDNAIRLGNGVQIASGQALRIQYS